MIQNPATKITLFLLFMSATLCAGGVLWEINSRVQTLNVSDQTDPLWIGSQLQFELLRLNNSLYAYEDGEVSPDDVSLRFNIAWSRINVVETGKMAQIISDLNIDDSAIHALKRTFQSIEYKIIALPPLDAPVSERQLAADDLINQISPFNTKARQFSLELAQSKNRMMHNFRNGMLSLSRVISFIFAVLTTLALIFIAFLALDLRASRTTSSRLERLAAEARAASVAKDKFMSAVSHELRTPLTSIMGGLKLLRVALERGQAAQVDKVLAIVERNSDRLLSLVNDILDAQKILEGKAEISLQVADISEIVEKSVEDCQGYAMQHRVEYQVDSGSTPIFVIADKGRISQVLTNFLSNAAKFTSPGDRILVRIVDLKVGVRVEVEDHGIGIPETERGQMFERFHQINPGQSGATKSSGLGLSIAKSIVELHGGEIGFKSSPGKGSTFWFFLKKAEQTSQENETPTVEVTSRRA